jgi:hypothetical protein
MSRERVLLMPLCLALSGDKQHLRARAAFVQRAID